MIQPNTPKDIAHIMKKWNALICFLLVTAFTSGCSNETNPDNISPIITEENKTLYIHPKSVTFSKKEADELKKEPSNKKTQQEQAEQVIEQKSQAKIDNQKDQENQTTSPIDEKSSQKQVLAQEEQQLLQTLKTLIEQKYWATMEQNFQEVKGNMEAINNRIKLSTLTFKKFKALIGEIEEKDPKEKVFYPTLVDMLAYVRDLTMLTQVSKKEIDPRIVSFIHTLDLTNPNLLEGKELSEKIATNLNQLMGNTRYISAYNQVNEKILAIYQNLQQQAEIHQATT